MAPLNYKENTKLKLVQQQKFLIKKEKKNKELVEAIKSDFKSSYNLHLKQQNVAQKITDFTNWLSEVSKK